jgi:hypothetical protein
VLRQTLVDLVAANAPPGYTADLPASLIEDMTSTGTGAISLIDQMRVDLVNSISPYGANLFLLTQLGNIYGAPQGAETNATVDVVFTTTPPTPGYAIDRGFIVSDGTHQYIVITGGVTKADGITNPVSCRATVPGIWAIPQNTVTQVATSLPVDSAFVLTVTNPLGGTPGLEAQSEGSYREQVLTSGLAASIGMGRYLKTLLKNVEGVDDRLIAVQQVATGGWTVIVGGGDIDEIGFAIWESLFDISTLKPSVMEVTGFTANNPGVVTTSLNHELLTGQSVTISGAVPSDYNATYIITVLTRTTFSVNFDTTPYLPYVGGGVVSPNPRNVAASIQDPPDVYTVQFVRPPQQLVTVTVTWNTTAENFVADSGLAQFGAPAVAEYINSILVTEPINLLSMSNAFRDAVAHIIIPELLTRLVFAVSIDGVGAVPVTGTVIIEGDPQGYFFALDSFVTVIRG